MSHNFRYLRVVMHIVSLIVILALTACQGLGVADTLKMSSATSTAEKSVANAIVTPTLEPTAPPTAQPTSTPTVEPIVILENSQYTFDAVLDYNKHVLTVAESIHFLNQTNQPLSEMVLVVPPNREAKVFNLEMVQIEGQDEVLQYALEDEQLTITLPETLRPMQAIDLQLSYKLKIPLRGGVLGYTTQQTNLSDWYPFIPPYEAGLGWIVHPGAEVGEVLVYDKADFDLTIKLTGTPNLLVAAGVEAVPVEKNTFQLVAENMRNLALSVSDRYQVLSQDFGPFTVNGYVFYDDVEAGRVVLENTGKALLVFSQLFEIPYPRKTMSFIEAEFPDGMEYDGMYYLGNSYFKTYTEGFQNYLSLLAVHETAHQWWYGLVANDQALEPWLDESLATYSEYLYVEEVHPELTAWWWLFRVDNYSPSGWVDSTVYDFDKFRPYVNAVYLQGARLIHELRLNIGYEAFIEGLRNYAQSSQVQLAHREDLLMNWIMDPNSSTSDILGKYFQNP